MVSPVERALEKAKQRACRVAGPKEDADASDRPKAD